MFPIDKWEQYGVLARRVVLTDETLSIKYEYDSDDEDYVKNGMTSLPIGLLLTNCRPIVVIRANLLRRTDLVCPRSLGVVSPGERR